MSTCCNLLAKTHRMVVAVKLDNKRWRCVYEFGACVVFFFFLNARGLYYGVHDVVDSCMNALQDC